MVTHTTPDLLMRRQFEHEWHRLSGRPVDATASREVSPERAVMADAFRHRHGSIDWLIDDALNLLMGHHDRPAADLAPIIRRLIVERDFIDENGDSVIDQGMLDALDRQVDLIVDVLEAIRSRRLADGQWSSAPVTPQMFG